MKISEYSDEWSNSYDEYLPLILYPYIDVTKYFERVSKDVKKRIYTNRENLPFIIDYNEYLKNDLEDWLKSNGKYEDILL